MQTYWKSGSAFGVTGHQVRAASKADGFPPAADGCSAAHVGGRELGVARAEALTSRRAEKGRAHTSTGTCTPGVPTPVPNCKSHHATPPLETLQGLPARPESQDRLKVSPELSYLHPVHSYSGSTLTARHTVGDPYTFLE